MDKVQSNVISKAMAGSDPVVDIIIAKFDALPTWQEKVEARMQLREVLEKIENQTPTNKHETTVHAIMIETIERTLERMHVPGADG